MPQPIRVFSTEPLTDRIALDFSRAGKLLGVEVLFAREAVRRGELRELDRGAHRGANAPGHRLGVPTATGFQPASAATASSQLGRRGRTRCVQEGVEQLTVSLRVQHPGKRVLMSVLLREFAQGLPESVIAVVMLDGAGWHGPAGLDVPPNVRLAFLPPYTPQLQPAERLWPSLRAGVANETFADIELLEDRLCDRCLSLSAQPELVSALSSYQWLPAAA